LGERTQYDRARACPGRFRCRERGEPTAAGKGEEAD
jgi:hypothetical protein